MIRKSITKTATAALLGFGLVLGAGPASAGTATDGTWAAATGVESAGGLRSTKDLGQPWSRAIGVASPAGRTLARDLRQNWARAIDPTNAPAGSHVGQAAAQN